MKELRIFVAGVAFNTPVKDVTKHFRQYGKDIKVQVPKSCGSVILNSLDYIQQGHFILVVGSMNTCISILAANSHEVNDRSLMCRPFLTGSDLYRANNKNNKKRIILKHVPFTVNQKSLKALMEQRFGKVENIFPFKSEKSGNNQIEAKRKYNSYSIMFDSHESALMAVAEEIIRLSGSTFCSAERFNTSYQRKKGFKPEPNTLTSVKRTAQFTPQSTLPHTTNEVREKKKKTASLQIHRVVKTRSRSQQGFSIRDGQSIRYESRRRTRSHDRSTITASYVGYELSQYLSDICSFVKPTAKLYRRIREENGQYLAAFELKNAWSSKNNTNFRTARNRHGYNPVRIDEHQIVDTIFIA